jgi:hypothetical protein
LDACFVFEKEEEQEVEKLTNLYYFFVSMFHRSYDLSCILDLQERTYVQNAVNGTNMACSDTVDAWIYVENGLIINDLDRPLGDYDTIPKTIFSAIQPEVHSGSSFSLVINILYNVARDYEGWRMTREQENSRKEASVNFWDTWRSIRLVPYYSSMSAGGTRSSIGPVLENFLQIKNFRNENSEKALSIEDELMNYLGSELKDKVNTLTDIVNLENSPYCNDLLTLMKKRLVQQQNMVDYNLNLVNTAMVSLSCAIESRNPTALLAALNPGWYSVNFQTSELYKKGSDLLVELS